MLDGLEDLIGAVLGDQSVEPRDALASGADTKKAKLSNSLAFFYECLDSYRLYYSALW